MNIMEYNNYIFNYPDIWHVILDIATEGAFLLSDARPSHKNSHPLTALRATCSAARKLITPPQHCTRAALIANGARIENLFLCNFASPSPNIFSDVMRIHLRSAQDMDAAKFLLTHHLMPVYDAEFIVNAASCARLDVCKLFNTIYDRGEYMYYSRIAQGAARTDRKDLFNDAIKHDIDFAYVMRGGIEGNNITYCEIALQRGVHASYHACDLVECDNVAMCIWLRDHIGQGDMVAFDDELVHASIDARTSKFIELIVQWGMQESPVPIHCTELLIEAAQKSLCEPVDYEICTYLYQISKLCDITIDHEYVINRLTRIGAHANIIDMIIEIAVSFGYCHSELLKIACQVAEDAKPAYQTGDWNNIGDIIVGNWW